MCVDALLDDVSGFVAPLIDAFGRAAATTAEGLQQQRARPTHGHRRFTSFNQRLPDYLARLTDRVGSTLLSGQQGERTASKYKGSAPGEFAVTGDSHHMPESIDRRGLGIVESGGHGDFT